MGFFDFFKPNAKYNVQDELNKITTKTLNSIFGSMMNFVFGNVENENHKFDDVREIIKKLSPTIDQMMLSVQKNDGVNPLGGEIQAYAVTETKFNIEGKLYFENKNGDVIMQEFISNNFEMTKYLTDKAIAELKQLNQIKYEINPPENK